MNRIMTPQNLLRLAVCLIVVLMPLTSAKADKISLEKLSDMMKDPEVEIMLGKAEMIEVDGAVADILVADPNVVDVMAVRSNRLYVVGTSLGDTNLMALDASGDVIKRINVHVQIDTGRVQGMLKDLYPNEDVQIRALTDQVVLTGEVSTPSVSNSVSNLVAQYVAEVTNAQVTAIDDVITNMMNVRGEQQVMLRVKIVEAERSALKDLGIESNITGGDIGAVATNLATTPALGLSAIQQLGVLSLNYNSGGFGPLNLIARALEEEGIVNTLAEPNLTAISGEQAGFLAGGEFPIPTEIDRQGNLIYEFRPFGVSLNFRPIVMSEKRISMELTTEVSTATFNQNLQLNGINVPTFNVRRAQTTVELPSGGTLMIAGLIQSDTVSGLTQIPGVGDIPVIGDLIKSDTFNRDETEVIVMITPYLVQPYAENHAQEPVIPDAPRPERNTNGLTEVFGNNIRRTYGSSAPESLMKEVGTFGYITD